MYEYLLGNLINYSQVDGNLRRTAKLGLVSELYRKQMNALALKYFGVDSNGEYANNKDDIVAYRCPYSGEVINDLSTAHLEHIIPVSSNGGTILFNCIPILNKVNLAKSDEPNLLAWWQEQNYFNYERLERLIQYMLEAYTLAFKEPTEEELYDYDNSLNNDDYIENDDLSVDLKDRIINKTNVNIQQNITYYQLISDLINGLSKNRDVSKYSSQLSNLKEQNIFGNINEIEKVIKAVQTVIKESLGENSHKFLSYTMKIDMYRLLKSLKTTVYENEIRERINNIKSILLNSNKNLNDYYESVQDIEEGNLLYYDNPSQEQMDWFINNLKISHNTKIRIFIEMLANSKYTNYIAGNPDNNNIFNKDNEVSFEGYEHINGLNTSYFWKDNSNKIIETIDDQKKELESKEHRTEKENEKLNKLNVALKAIDDYDFANSKNLNRRIDKFIEMLANSKYTNYIDGKPDSKNIFKQDSEVRFEGYEHINGLNTSNFWTQQSNKIIETIDVQKKELESKEHRTEEENEKLNKLNVALKAIDDYDFANKTNSNRRIDKFIEMLANSKYTNYIDGNPDNNNIFASRKEVSFEGYEHINGLNTSQFWSTNSNKIIETIDVQKKELESKEHRTEEENEKLNKLKVALKAIDDYNFANKANSNRKIDKFIEMLANSKYTNYIDGKPDSKNIFNQNNEVSFEGYEHINGLNTSYFWPSNSNKIIETIDVQKKELESKEHRTEEENEKLNKLNVALKAIDDYDFANKQNLNRRIDKFIEMLANSKYTNYIDGNPDSKNIFNQNNEVSFEGYEHINGLNASYFWSYNSNKIIETIDVQKKELESKEHRTEEENEKLNKLNVALKAIDDYDFANKTNLNRRIDKFIEMLTNSKYTNYIDGKRDNNNIFARQNEVSFEGYEHINGLNTSTFWSSNSNKIILLLFYNKIYDKKKNTYIDANLDYGSSKYNTARTAIMEYLNNNRRKKKRPEFKNINEYIDTLDKTKKEVKAVMELRDSLLQWKKHLMIENQELTTELNSSYRKAM